MSGRFGGLDPAQRAWVDDRLDAVHTAPLVASGRAAALPRASAALRVILLDHRMLEEALAAY